MLNANALRAEIARNGFTQGEVAKLIGMSANTFSQKMKKGSFGLPEADALIDLLGIQNPGDIFFSQE